MASTNESKQAVIMCGVIDLVMFILDLAKGIYAAYQHHDKEDMWWMGWTIGFMFITSVAASFMCIRLVYIYSDSSAKWCYILLLIVFTPIAPFILLLMNMCDPTRPVARSVGAMKLIKPLFESFTMASLQMHIMFQSLPNVRGGKQWQMVEMPDGYWPHRQMKLVEVLPNVEHWQIVTITVSLILLTYAVSTNIAFKNAGISSRVIYFIFGLLTLTSRIMVYCLFSRYSPVLYFAPLLVQLIIYFSFISSCCQGRELDFANCRAFIFSLATPYDGFTPSSIGVSFTNGVFAVGGYFLNLEQPVDLVENVAIAAIVLSAISFVFNVVVACTPDLKYIGKDWFKALEYQWGYDKLSSNFDSDSDSFDNL